MKQYRITQISDTRYGVERLEHHRISGFWWWSKDTLIPYWRPVLFSPDFPSQEAAQKWLDDKRKYPIVVKEPA